MLRHMKLKLLMAIASALTLLVSAAAWAQDNVRVNAAAPGLIRSNMTEGMVGTPFEEPEIERTPMKRWGEPGEIASVYLFLASPAASFMTGHTICVDGGQLIG